MSKWFKVVVMSEKQTNYYSSNLTSVEKTTTCLYLWCSQRCGYTSIWTQIQCQDYAKGKQQRQHPGKPKIGGSEYSAHNFSVCQIMFRMDNRFFQSLLNLHRNFSICIDIFLLHCCASFVPQFGCMRTFCCVCPHLYGWNTTAWDIGKRT